MRSVEHILENGLSNAEVHSVRVLNSLINREYAIYIYRYILIIIIIGIFWYVFLLRRIS